ncbi:MAG TPA: M3 family oligoendopeptidase [Gaiellaceae bacterium]|nr:M3 family oligoendopeptidase [Gaiellaceae bacterium]
MAVSSSLSATDVRWNLSDLEPDAEQATRDLDGLLVRARDFAERRRGTVGASGAQGLRELLDELDEITQDASRIHFYATAREHTEATDPEANDLATLARDRAADLESTLLFVELEWLALEDADADALLEAPELEPYAHRLRVTREEKPYVLPEGEEQALNARAPVISAWSSLHGRELATLTVEFDGGDGPEPHTIDRLLSYVHHPEREMRLAALDVLYEALERVADVQAACYDAIVGDRLSLDRLRRIPDVLWPTNQRNELTGDVVEAMMAAVEDNYPLGRRWFVRKAGVLGLDRLQLADQYAPIGSDRRVEWTEAISMVDDSLRDFSPRFGEIFQTCLGRGHVDAEPRPGKVGGAYCNSVSKTVLPYVLLNYTDQLRDVVTLAHEFGHAVHGALALERQTYRSYHTGIAVAEVPSTFAQLLAVERLIDNEEDSATRIMLLADRAESAMASIFRQTMMTRFEIKAYAVRGEGKALTSDRLSDLWFAENESYYGDSIELPTGYRLGWSYIPHFIHVRFYTYAYAFAHLVAFSLLARYREDPERFAPAYIEFLSSGASRSPQDLLAPLGVDLRDPETWARAFAEFDRCVAEAEAGADELQAAE